MNIIAHWSMNDPTTLTRFWDNSGNKHHGSFGATKPLVVTDSPAGSRAMSWPHSGASVKLPTGLNPVAVSYWVKKGTGSTVDFPCIADNEWHFCVVSDGKIYVDMQEKGSEATDTVVSLLETALDGGTDFTMSDLYYYGAALTTAEIAKIYQVKTSIVKTDGLKCKEFVEEVGSGVKVLKNGVVKAESFDATASKTSFTQTGVKSINIVEY